VELFTTASPFLQILACARIPAKESGFFVADVAQNILFDTSLSFNFDFIEDFAGRFGAERVVFGTDLYSHPVGRRISHLLPQILESQLSDAEKALILAGNARRLFGIS
jgi:predicted TIM-barrel fold metal-dependent hydrolase